MDDCDLRDLGYSGQWFTWERGKSAAICVRERLDRFLASASWYAMFPSSSVEHLTRQKSDHAAICLTVREDKVKRKNKGRKGFKFETCWLLDEGCEGVVKQAWERCAGSTMDRITSVARDLKSWSIDIFDKLGKQIQEAESALKAVQQRPITDRNCNECARLEAVLDDLHEKHEAYWFLRSRVAEVKDGDRNTKYFHHKASQRKRRNYIKGLNDHDGVRRTEEEEIESIICDYFTNVFSSTEPMQNQMQEVLKYVGKTITEDMNSMLLKPYSKEEVYEALKLMHPCKAPGPDGMHACYLLPTILAYCW